jgi:hypothetical protein
MVYKDSAKFWFPRLKVFDSRIKVPKTVFVDYDESEVFGHNTGFGSAYDKLFLTCEAVVQDIFGGTAFIRTDVTSAKHLGINAIKVSPTNPLHFPLRQTLKHAETKTYLSKYKSSAIMLREWLILPHPGTAFNGLPIGREWRVFAGPNGVNCVNGYWPKNALDGFMDKGSRLPDLSPIAPSHILKAASIAAASMGGGMWSVDFMQDDKGQHWLIDMARGENSYHHEDCQCGYDPEK